MERHRASVPCDGAAGICTPLRFFRAQLKRRRLELEQAQRDKVRVGLNEHELSRADHVIGHLQSPRGWRSKRAGEAAGRVRGVRSGGGLTLRWSAVHIDVL